MANASKQPRPRHGHNLPRRGKRSGTIKPPRLGTTACRDFFVTWARVNRFFHFVVHMAGSLDSVARGAHDALIETARSQEETARLIRDWKARRSAVDELKTNRQFLLEIVLVRHIENYLNYLATLLFAIFTQRPETLRSGEAIDLKTVLAHDTMNALIQSIAERKVESLSYRSFSDLQSYFSERFSLALIEKSKEPKIIEAIETRNISVHNRCIINDRYVNKTGTDENMVGQRRELYRENIDELVPLLASAVKALDVAARRELKLRGARFDIVEYLKDD